MSRGLAIVMFIMGWGASAIAGPIETCFTPGEDCAALIISKIDAAKKAVRVQAYSFTSAPIAKALIDAKKRGVDVRALLDKSQRTEKYSGADTLANSGVPVAIDAAHAIAHNKIMIIDQATVVTGSFNFTKSAQERNAENVVILQDADVVKRYARNWDLHAQHSDPYQGKGQIPMVKR